MVILGITGPIGSGKTTFAAYAAVRTDNSAHWESWQIVAETANALRAQTTPHPAAGDMAAINTWLCPLPAIIQRVTNVSATFATLKLTPQRLQRHPENYHKLYEYLELMQVQPALRTGEIAENNKDQLRSLLQWLGGYLVTVLGGIWYDEIIRRIRAQPGLDVATIGGVRFLSDAETVKGAGGVIVRIERPDVAPRDSRDLTERERNAIHPDIVVVNNAGLAQLANCAAQVIEDMHMNKHRSRYDAATF